MLGFDYGHRVPNHKSACRNFHGHRAKVEITLAGPLIGATGDSSEGMVYDFSDLKALMTTKIHDVLDHGMVWYKGDQIAAQLYQPNGPCYQMKNLCVPFIPTAENLAAWCAQQIGDELPRGQLTVQRVRFHETPNSFADWKP